jgi:putative addiction module component (TIGR02574 family)
MAVAEILSEIDRLPWSDRMAIVDHILDEIPAPPGALSEDEAVALASRRIEEMRSGKVKGISHDEMMRRLRAKLQEE